MSGKTHSRFEIKAGYVAQARAAPMRFGRSRVHAWGLFSARAIAAEEFLVEYVGELIRSELADRCAQQVCLVHQGSGGLES